VLPDPGAGCGFAGVCATTPKCKAAVMQFLELSKASSLPLPVTLSLVYLIAALVFLCGIEFVGPSKSKKVIK
jgi:hypothetical protein